MSKKSYNNPYKIIEMLKKENQSLNKLYQETLLKMKEIQKDYDSMYSNFVNENMAREIIMRNDYQNYQELLQQHFQKEENNYIEEIKNLKLQIQEKENIIIILQNNNTLLNDKLSKNELLYKLKEKEYKKQLFNKDRLLIKSSDIVNKNSQEVMEDVKKLKEEIQYFQNKSNNNKAYNKKISSTINDNMNNANYFNNDYKRQQQIKKSLSSNNFNDPNCYMNLNNKNNYNECYNNFVNNNDKKGNFNKKQNYQNPIKTKALNNSNEIRKYKTRIINLINIIKQKEKEINFWKNVRQNLYMTNKTQNFDNFSNNTYMNSMNNYRNVNSEQKSIKRCYSQTSGQIRKNKKKKFNLCLVDSNMINKPVKRNIISYKHKTNT